MSENPTSFFESPLTGIGYHTKIPNWDLGDSIKPKFPLGSIPASAWQAGEEKEEKPGVLDKLGENFTSYLDQEKKNAQRERAFDAYYDSLKRARDKSAVTADLGGGNTLFAPDQSRYLGATGLSSGGGSRMAGQIGGILGQAGGAALGSTLTATGGALAGSTLGTAVGSALGPLGALGGAYLGSKLFG